MVDSDSPSIVDALRSDHRAIAALVDDATATAASSEAAAAREQLVMNLVRHLVAEEQYLYPAVREHIADGEALAERGFQQDRLCEKHLRRLEDPDITHEQLAAVWADIRSEFAIHITLQEPMLAALAASCPGERLARLGEGVLGAEQLAPTRPRPIASEHASVSKVLSLVEGFVDQVRDSYTHRGVAPDGRRD